MANDLDLTNTNNILAKINETLGSVMSKMDGVASKLLGINNSAANLTKQTQDQTVASDKTTDALKNQTEQTEKLTDANNKAASGMQSLQEFAEKTTKSLLGTEEEAKNTNAELLSLQSKLNSTASVAAILGTAFFGVSKEFDSFHKSLDGGIGSFTNSTNSIEALENGLSNLSQIPVIGPLADMASKIVSTMKEFGEASNDVKRMESALISFRGQYGGFQEMGSRETFLSDLPRQVSRFTETVAGVGAATNTSIQEVERYSRKLMKIPQAFDYIIPKFGNAADQMSLLEAAMRTARGTTGDFEDVFNSMELEFKQFGTTTERSLDYMSRLYEVSQMLGISFDSFKGISDGVVKNFAVLGDNTKSATELVGGLTGALRQSGLGIEPITRMIEGITGSISNLSMSQKAFLAQQSGMAGGLQGAFQIDQMIASGNIRGVYEKMESTLKEQFGGRIVTREEGASNASDAAQLYRQMAFLRQGPFGQMVKSDAEAYKLLEVFKSGTGPSAEMIERGNSALLGAADADRTIQEKQNDSLVTISNFVGASLRELQIQSALAARQVGGQGATANVLREAALMASKMGTRAINNEIESTPQGRILSSAENLLSLFKSGEGIGKEGLHNAVVTQMKTLPDFAMHPEIKERGGTAPPMVGGIIEPQMPTISVNYPKEIKLTITDGKNIFSTTAAVSQEHRPDYQMSVGRRPE